MTKINYFLLFFTGFYICFLFSNMEKLISNGYLYHQYFYIYAPRRQSLNANNYTTQLGRADAMLL